MLSLLWKGIVIGIIVSAPLGPVGVLCIQRTLNKGRWYGFVTGVGAAISDIFYALLTGYGMSFVFDYVQQNMYYLQLLGSIMLLGFGIYTFRSNPVSSIRTISTNKGTYLQTQCPAFLWTCTDSDSRHDWCKRGGNSCICSKTLLWNDRQSRRCPFYMEGKKVRKFFCDGQRKKRESL